MEATVSTKRLPSRRTDAEAWALVEPNTRLIWWAINRFFPMVHDELERDESYSDGMLGLFRAAQLFDESRGIAFSTYAVGWLRQSIGRGRRLRMAGGGDLSLDRMYEAGETTITAADFLIDDTARPEGDAVWSATIEPLLARMDDTGRDIVAAVCGSDTLTAVAERHGISRQAVDNRWRRRMQLALASHLAA